MSQNTAPLEKQDTELNLEQGQVLANRYKLVKEIGRGGYGSVWLVEDNFIKEQLVMKFLHQSLVSDEVAVERFVRELRLARKITHTNIIRLFDYLDLGPVAAISMEYFPGQALSSIVHQGAMEPTRVIKLIKAISGALDVAHQADVIHRDMKPANILVDEKDNIKIVDFGIAAASKHAESRLTRTGTLVGTPTYISPEQIQGKVVDGRTDLYSLGVIMYEMLAGQPPYQAEDPMALVFMHVEGNARRVEEINPVIPKDLADIVHKCIAPDPNSRYQSMAELAQALSEVQLA
jgi:serine/threonine-protein kinase